MRICITAEGDNLEAKVDPRFGRCAFFILYDTGSGSFEAVSNEKASGMGGVGIQNGQVMAEMGVNLVITGNLGPNAAGVLQQAGIKSITGISGKVRDVVERYKKGELKPDAVTGATVPSHFGMGKEKK